MTLDVTGGPSFRQTRFTTGSENITTVRAGLDFSWRVLDDITLLEKAQIFLNSEIKSTTAIMATINDALAARLSFDFTRQDKVPAGRRRTDTATLASIVYSFGD
jgi:putative salt-induced outer membrane protein